MYYTLKVTEITPLGQSLVRKTETASGTSAEGIEYRELRGAARAENRKGEKTQTLTTAGSPHPPWRQSWRDRERRWGEWSLQRLDAEETEKGKGRNTLASPLTPPMPACGGQGSLGNVVWRGWCTGVWSKEG